MAVSFCLAFAVTETGPEAAAGDYFTAIELGAALPEMAACRLTLRPLAPNISVQPESFARGSIFANNRGRTTFIYLNPSTLNPLYVIS